MLWNREVGSILTGLVITIGKRLEESLECINRGRISTVDIVEGATPTFVRKGMPHLDRLSQVSVCLLDW